MIHSFRGFPTTSFQTLRHGDLHLSNNVYPSLQLGKQPEPSRMHHLCHSLWQIRRTSQLHSQHLAGILYSISSDLSWSTLFTILGANYERNPQRVEKINCSLRSWFLGQLSCPKTKRPGPSCGKTPKNQTPGTEPQVPMNRDDSRMSSISRQVTEACLFGLQQPPVRGIHQDLIHSHRHDFISRIHKRQESLGDMVHSCWQGKAVVKLQLDTTKTKTIQYKLIPLGIALKGLAPDFVVTNLGP